VSRLVKGYHRQILEKVGRAGRWKNDVYLHHFWSSPSVVRDFSTVDMHNVVAYVLIVDSVCLEPETGVVARRLYHNEFRIDVDTH
jgi:hypothetical protein